jgi:hypothetical protein
VRRAALDALSATDRLLADPLTPEQAEASQRNAQAEYLAEQEKSSLTGEELWELDEVTAEGDQDAPGKP